MKIKISKLCQICLTENNGQNAKEIYDKFRNQIEQDYKLEINSENQYLVECENGHKKLVMLQAENFEILFDLASLALNDGYSKEAFTTMFSSYERFVEYFVKVICHSKSTSKKDFKDTWNKMAKQSERQIGAFFILQLLELGSVKYSIPQKWIELRNDIVHKGHIPSSKKVIEFGNFLLDMIQNALFELNSKYPKSIKFVNSIWLIPENKEYLTRDIFSSAGIPTIINLQGISHHNNNKIKFEEALEEIKNNGFYKHFYSKE